MYWIAPLVGLMLASPASRAEITIHPYVQDLRQRSVSLQWEGDSSEESLVRYGADESLGLELLGSSRASPGGDWLHEALIEDLLPGTRYFYQVSSGSDSSAVASFVTPCDFPLRFVAISDSQFDLGNPTRLQEVVEEGIIPFAQERSGLPLDEALHFVLVAGDLVANGTIPDEWVRFFFQPTSPLFASIPVWPVYGNHEENAETFREYFILPENGLEGSLEHDWSRDLGNVRVIALDTDAGFTSYDQLDWLDARLAEVCEDEAIDFVIAMHHHPYHSELWPSGNLTYVGEILERLESFALSCDRPVVDLFGHTHGYSRGASDPAPLMQVNVASAAGNLDYWGEYEQINYPEFFTSQDEYGFSWFEALGGDQPSLRMVRVSRGDEFEALDNVIRDEFVLRRGVLPPEAPRVELGGAAIPECAPILIHPGCDPSGDSLQAVQVQVARSTGSCDGFDGEIVLDRTRWDRDEYGGVDLLEGDSATVEVLGDLPESTSLCARARIRSSALLWSAWSSPLGFTTSAGSFGEELIVNGGAEDGIEGWTLRSGNLESLVAKECEGTVPFEGERYFSVGGLCDATGEGEAYQLVDLGAQATTIDGEGLFLRLSLATASYGYTDLAEVWLLLQDADGVELGRTEPLGLATESWSELGLDLLLPSGTRRVEVVIHGTRVAGEDNDAYLDALSLRAAPSAVLAACLVEPEGPAAVMERCEGTDTGDSDEDSDDCWLDDTGSPEAEAPKDKEPGCGCHAQAGPWSPFSVPVALLLLLATALARREGPADPPAPSRRLPFDHLDKVCMAASNAERGVSSTPVWQLRIRGRFDALIARRAVGALLQRHPVLAARVVSLEEGRTVDQAAALAWAIDPEPDIQEIFRAVELGEGGLDALQSELFAHDLDLVREYPLRMTWAPTGPDEGVLHIAQHHSLADGRALFAMIQDFTTLYEEIEAGRPGGIEEVPRLPEDLLVQPQAAGRFWWRHAGNLAHLGTLFHLLLFPPDALASNPPVASGQSMDFKGANRALYHLVGDPLLERLRAGRARHGCSVNELLCGALSAALARWTQAQGRPLRRFNLFLPADMRPRGAGLLSSANHLSSYLVHLDTRGTPRPLDLAGQVHAQIRQQHRRRFPEKKLLSEIEATRRLSPAQIRQSLSGGRRALFNIPFSNLIAISPQTPYATSSWVGRDLRVMTPCGYLQGLNVTVLRYHGELCFNFNYKASAVEREQVERLILAFDEALRELTALDS